jgi:Asp-tRNA(Asn)/Glu-tRNA(Gln) amidotransferase A subunit family amidase
LTSSVEQIRSPIGPGLTVKNGRPLDLQIKMKKRPGSTAASILAGLLLIACFGNCAMPQRPTTSASRDHVFIAYWPHQREHRHCLRLAVKDNIDVKGVVTTDGSEYVAKTSPPATKDAECLAIALERNVRIVGKTNLSEFAIAPSGLNEYFGTPENASPRQNLIPGGSSSGSAVAIAEGMADVAFGTDTAGSVRVPAACIGIVGLKTTFGLVSLKGVLPIDPEHLDTVGPLAKDVDHVVEGMDLLQNGFAGRYRSAVAAKPFARKIRIGRLYLTGTDPKIDKAVDDALARGHFKVVTLDNALAAKWNQAKSDGDVLAAAGAWINYKKYVGKLGVGANTDAIIAFGEFEYTMNYRSALRRQVEWERALRQVFEKVDFIALPTLQTLPPAVPVFETMALLEARMLNLQNTAPVNFAGNPALAIPIPVNEKAAPITSLQLVGPRFSEAELLNAGRLVEAGVRGAFD